jgi:hypothetical protein
MSTKLKLYKFRGIASAEDKTSVGRIDQIINTGQLYGAKFSEMNDPMEGAFQYWATSNSNKNLAKISENIIGEKTRYGIVSLTSNWSNLLMWSYYASGMHGICIEIEIPTEEGFAIPISYSHVVEDLNRSQNLSADQMAEQLLLRKAHVWSHEQEYRILVKDKNLVDVSISGVLLGERFDRESFAKLNSGHDLVDLCNQRRIPVYNTSVDWSHQTVLVHKTEISRK